MTDLHVKYRPQTLDEVVGQDATVKSLQALLLRPERAPHAYLFNGPAGTGKTTLARIIARTLKVMPYNVVEVNGAAYTGIDESRRIRDLIAAPALGKDRRKMLIMDECHRLSKQAWDSWLKIAEEPPPHLYLAFCTTELEKVPKTLKTRCHAYVLGAVSEDTLYELMVSTLKRAKLNARDDVMEYISAHSDGSPRQALVYLAQCRRGTVKDAKLIIRKVENSAEGNEIAIARMLVAGNARWEDFMRAVEKVDAVESESIRIITVNYVAAVMRKAPAKRAAGLAAVLEAFEKPYNQSDKQAPLILSIARCVL